VGTAVSRSLFTQKYVILRTSLRTGNGQRTADHCNCVLQRLFIFQYTSLQKHFFSNKVRHHICRRM